MIRYSLICDKDHEFDGWFGSSDDFDTQAKRGLVECPMCGSVKVQKALMTPGVPARSNRKGDDAQPVTALSAPADPKTQGDDADGAQAARACRSQCGLCG
jgi:hypothetical protein